MKVYIKLFFIIGFIVPEMYAQTDSITNIESLIWLSGSWITEQDGSVAEELWMVPKGNGMPGTGRTVSSNDKTFFEFMRIAETDSGIYFFGSPKGENTTPFKLVKTGKYYIQFENKLHNFPQRIIYKLITPGQLNTRVEGTINNKLEFYEWNYQRNKNQDK